jgi:hypothetical protein
MKSEIAHAMRLRADELQMLGEYIGFFEWLVWAVMRQVGVHILMGSNVVDVLSLFGHGLGGFEPVDIHRVAAVRGSPCAWLSAAVHGTTGWTSNHFMIGCLIAGRAEISLSDVLPHKSSTIAQAAWMDAKDAGWALKETAANGDCGIDAMAYHEGLPRCSKSWLKLRNEIANFMRLVADSAPWQAAFELCAEDGRGASVGSICTDSGGSSGSTAASCLAAFAAPYGVEAAKPAAEAAKTGGDSSHPTPKTMEAKAIASEGAFASATAEASSPTPAASAAETVAATDPAANEGASLPASEKSDAKDEAGSFCTWLQLQPASIIGKLAASYPDFKLAEAQWLCAHTKKEPSAAKEPVAKQEYRSSLLRHRLLIGISFWQWRSNAGSGKCTSLHCFVIRLNCSLGPSF